MTTQTIETTTTGTICSVRSQTGISGSRDSDRQIRPVTSGYVAKRERWRHSGALFLGATERGELAAGMTVAAAETRMAATAWPLPLTDEMPRTKVETAALVANLIPPLLNEPAIDMQ